MDGVSYVLRTGRPWEAAAPEFGSGSSLHRYLQNLVALSVFERLWKLPFEDMTHGRRSSGHGSGSTGVMNAPLGGENRVEFYGSTKSETKRSLLTDGAGVPLGAAREWRQRIH